MNPQNESVNNDQRGNLFFLIGPSGAGKSSLIRAIVDRDPGLVFVPSTTTRGKRIDESQGDPYFFVSEEEFSATSEKGGFLEWQFVHGNRYGSSMSIIDSMLQRGLDGITDMDVLGAHDAILRMPADICSIFVVAPSQEHLERRIAARSPEEESATGLRMRRVGFELSMAGLSQYLVLNDELSETVDALLAIVRARRAERRLQHHVSSNGGIVTLQTAAFSFRRCADEYSRASCLDLPKTLLGRYESPLDALLRLVDMLSFVVGQNPPDVDGVIAQSGFQIHVHESPTPHREIELHFEVTETSPSSLATLASLCDLYCSKRGSR